MSVLFRSLNVTRLSKLFMLDIEHSINVRAHLSFEAANSVQRQKVGRKHAPLYRWLGAGVERTLLDSVGVIYVLTTRSSLKKVILQVDHAVDLHPAMACYAYR